MSTLPADDFVLVGFGSTLALQLLLAWMLRRPWRPSEQVRLDMLGPAEVAILSGGSDAAIDAALVDLAAGGEIVAEGGRIRGSATAARNGTDGAVQPRSGLEGGVLDAVARGGTVSLRDLRRLAPRLTEPASAALTQAGCQLNASRTRQMRAVIASPAILLAACAGLQMVSTGLLAPYLTVCFVAAVMAGVGLRVSSVTGGGDWALAQLRVTNMHAQHQLDAESAPAELAMAFALFGSGALPPHLHGLRACVEQAGSRIRPTMRPGEKASAAMRARW